MRRTPRFLSVCAMVACATVAAGGERPLREVNSANERFGLRIEPGRPGRGIEQSCRATLVERQPASGRERRRWERPLVNDVAPGRAVVRDDGRYVVTLDEFRRGGARHALVIYGARGELLRHFLLTDLLAHEDWSHVKSTKSRVDWLDKAELNFEGDNYFVISLPWEREIRIDLRRLRVVRGASPDGDTSALDGDDIPAEALQALGGGESETDLDADALENRPDFGDDSLENDGDGDSPEALRLRALAALREQMEADGTAQDNDALDAVMASAVAGLQAETVATSAETEAQRQAIEEKISERQSDEAGAEEGSDSKPESDSETTEINLGGARFEVTIEPPGAAALLEGQTLTIDQNDTAVTIQLTPAGVDDAAPPTPEASKNTIPGVANTPAMPMPDPAHPVDYLAWLNDQSVTPGPNAAPMYESAIARRVPFQGDDDLYQRALAGDADALQSPEITSWLAANAEAVGEFRNASTMDFRGWQLSADDGSMVGALLPNIGPMRDLARTSVIMAEQAALQGRPADAADIYVDTVAVGSHAQSGPTMIENLVGVAVTTTASDHLLDLAASDNSGAIDYEALSARLEEAHRPTRSMADTVQTERAVFMDSLQRMYRMDETTGQYKVDLDQAGQMLALTGNDSPEQKAALASLAAADYQQAVQQANEMYDTLTSAVQKPYVAARDTLGELENRVAARPDTNPMIKMLLPSISRAYMVSTRGEATRRAAQVVTSLRAYQQRTGAYPDSLDAVGGGSIVDPFTGQPFVYRRNGADFELYSVGANGQDDGGVHDPRADSNDLRFWPRPAK